METSIPYGTGVALAKEDWVDAALAALAEQGLAGVAVSPLARTLGATKGSFYWHFKDRDALIAATLEVWARRDTAETVAAVRTVDDPRERIVVLARLALTDAIAGTDAHAGIVTAAADPRIGPTLARVTVERLNFIQELLEDLGYEAPDARQRATLAYSVYLGISDLRRAAPQAAPSAQEAEMLVGLMVEILLGRSGEPPPPL